MTDPYAVLLRLARREIEDDDPDTPPAALIALHRRPTRELFELAAALTGDPDATNRELGLCILRELGDPGPDGRRPFSAETVPLLRSRLRDEPDPGVLRWIVSALGYHGAREALPEVLVLAGHHDDRVRFHVAAALPALVDPAGVEPPAVAALRRLCHDDDPDIRYYALYAATREVTGMDTEALAAGFANDPDASIRELAAEGRRATGEPRP